MGGADIVSGVKGSRFGREERGEEWGMEEFDSETGEWLEEDGGDSLEYTGRDGVR